MGVDQLELLRTDDLIRLLGNTGRPSHNDAANPPISPAIRPTNAIPDVRYTIASTSLNRVASNNVSRVILSRHIRGSNSGDKAIVLPKDR